MANRSKLARKRSGQVTRGLSKIIGADVTIAEHIEKVNNTRYSIRTPKVDIKLEQPKIPRVKPKKPKVEKPKVEKVKVKKPKTITERSKVTTKYKNEYTKLKNRINRIVEKYDKEYGEGFAKENFTAVKQFLEKDFKMAVKGLSNKELETLIKELQRIGSFKTSTMKGVESYMKNVYPRIKEHMQERDFFNNVLEYMNKDKADEDKVERPMTMYEMVRSLYNEFVEQFALLDKIKYEVMDAIETMLNDNIDPNEMYDRVREMYDDFYDHSQSGWGEYVKYKKELKKSRGGKEVYREPKVYSLMDQQKSVSNYVNKRKSNTKK